ncbi:MAG TPA: hypothetical protein VMG10_10745 [Gemmataceae bacterium]|nr:hypothetical protein [Gemmataceae bacterium]
MIHTDQDELVAVCNDCSSEQYGGTLEFRPFVAQLRSDGWRIDKVDGEWHHTCPECLTDD